MSPTLVLLTVLATAVSPGRPPALERVLRHTLQRVMRCPEWGADEGDRPVAAFSPARYLQLVALVRKESGEDSCGRRSHRPFHLHDPRSWNFCAMGICSEDSCSCFKNFVGEKCGQFRGRCWLFYCRLVGCNREAPSLDCSCHPSLYGAEVARGIYFYDHGFERSYIPPPAGYRTTAFVDSHLIREVSPGQFEIIGGDARPGLGYDVPARRHEDAHSDDGPGRPPFRWAAPPTDNGPLYRAPSYRSRRGGEEAVPDGFPDAAEGSIPRSRSRRPSWTASRYSEDGGAGHNQRQQRRSRFPDGAWYGGKDPDLPRRRDTIRDVWAEDEDEDEEAGDSEDFKFSSGSPTYGLLSVLATYFYSAIVIFILPCFLE